METTHSYAGGEDRARTMHAIDWIAMVLMIVGGANWGLIALADFDLVAALFGEGSALARLVYGLVGLAAIYGIYMVIRWGARQHAA